MSNVSKEFKKTIEAHLQGRAASDELFAKTLAKPAKNIDDCCTYILNEVQRRGQQGYTDSDVFGMAVHYYDEDNIKAGKAVTNARVVVNHVVELSAEDKEQAHKQALDNAIREEQQRLAKKPVAKTTTPPTSQPSLF